MYYYIYSLTFHWFGKIESPIRIRFRLTYLASSLVRRQSYSNMDIIYVRGWTEDIFSKRNNRRCPWSSLRLSVSTDATTTGSREEGEGGEERSWFCVLRAAVVRNGFVPSPVDGGSEDRRGTKRKREGEVVEALRRGGWKLVPHTSPWERTGGWACEATEASRDSNWFHPQSPSRRSGRPARSFSYFLIAAITGQILPPTSPTSSSYADGIGQSSSASRGFVKELRIHAHQIWNRACSGMVSIADTRAFFPSRDISALRDSASLRVILGYRGLKWNHLAWRWRICFIDWFPSYVSLTDPLWSKTKRRSRK